MFLIHCIKAIFSVIGVVIGYMMLRDLRQSKNSEESTQGKFQPIKAAVMGFVSNFFDAFGVGSYAILTSFNRVWNVIPILLLLGTLTVGVEVFMQRSQKVL